MKSYQREIEKKYSKYKETKKKQSYEELCFPKKFSLRKSQQFPSEYISPNTKNKNLLLFHQIGSGKTCTMIRIAEKWKKKRKIIFVCPAGLIGNFMGELRSQCADDEYLNDEERSILKSGTPEQQEKVLQRSDERIKKNYEIYSQHKFASLLSKKEIDFNNKILLIDEIQNMVSATGTFYKILLAAINKAPKDLRIILATATPMFDRPYELGLTMNLLRPKEKFPSPVQFTETFVEKKMEKDKITYSMKNKQLLEKMLGENVSYFSGGNPLTMPEKKIIIHKCIMSKYQKKSYLSNLKKSKHYKKVEEKGMKLNEVFKKGEILELPNNFFIGPRLLSNISYPEERVSEEGFKLLKKNTPMKEYSTKIAKMIEIISASKGKSYIYSNFRNYGGLLPIEFALKNLGYKNYEKFGPGKNRYAFWSGEESRDYRNKVVKEYNSEKNMYGENLKIIMISPAGKEGLSLFGVRDAHIFEPYWNISRIDQIIGRGVRFCSHKLMKKDERKVDIHIYLSSLGTKEISIDEYIYDMANKKQKLISEFENSLKNVAIDKYLY